MQLQHIHCVQTSEANKCYGHVGVLNAILDLPNTLKTSPMLDTADDQAFVDVRAKMHRVSV
jgi:hypothetical protein